MMTLEETIEFYRESARRAHAAIPEAVKNAGPIMRLFNLSAAFRDQLTAGLFVWRHRIAHPSHDFRAALEFAFEAAEQHTGSAFQPNWLSFPFYEAVAVDILVSGTVCELLAAQIPEDVPPNYLKSANTKDQTLHVLLAHSLISGAPGAAAREAQTVSYAKRAHLFLETYRCHIQLLDQVARRQSLSSQVATAEELFLRRKNTKYYSGSFPHHGGGTDNANVVDFYLSAVLRLAATQGIDIPETIHVWPDAPA